MNYKDRSLKSHIRKKSPVRIPFYLVALAGCGSGDRKEEIDISSGLDATRDLFILQDTRKNKLVSSNDTKTGFQNNNADKFNTPPTDPYWIKSLEMEDYHLVRQYFETQPKVIYYSFPSTMPTYFDKLSDGYGWEPVGFAVQKATEEILRSTEDILNIRFERTDELKQPFVVALMANDQGNTDAYSYFPSTEFSIGSDIFLDNSVLNPSQLSHNKTNYDYEIIVHELGHALGLKHPFAPLGDNKYVLPKYEDTSRLTAMTYTENTNFFNGDFRPFDYLTLVNIYGINPNYNSGDNVYTFSAVEAKYIIDAGGHDLIDTSASTESGFIDLRENSHSYLGVEHEYISAAYQMTISANSMIEDVTSGSGNDHIIGNSLDNRIITNAGDDIIFAGEGRDIIHPGIDFNRVNLFEKVSSNDFIFFSSSLSDQFTEIYSFSVIGICDVLVFDCEVSQSFRISPVLSFSESINFNQFDIYRFDNFNLEKAASSLQSSAYSDKIVLSASGRNSDFDTQVYFFDKSNVGNGNLLHLADISTNNATLEDWGVENFFLI